MKAANLRKAFMIFATKNRRVVLSHGMTTLLAQLKLWAARTWDQEAHRCGDATEEEEDGQTSVFQRDASDGQTSGSLAKLFIHFLQ